MSVLVSKQTTNMFSSSDTEEQRKCDVFSEEWKIGWCKFRLEYNSTSECPRNTYLVRDVQYFFLPFWKWNVFLFYGTR